MTLAGSKERILLFKKKIGDVHPGGVDKMSWVRRVIITTIVIIIIIIIITVIIVITIVVVIIREFTPTGRQEEGEGKTLVCDKRDKAITCILCRDLHLALIFCGLFKTICLKESEVWRKVISNKIVVTVVTQGLPSSLPVTMLTHRLKN